MEKKKILIISKSFHPQQNPRAFRTTELVKELARQGHEVTLYTVKDETVHAPFEKEHEVQIKDLGKLRFKSVDLTDSRSWTFFFKRAVRRISSLVFEYPNVELMVKVKNALQKERGYDLLISIAAPHPVHWGVAWARSVSHPIAKVWVADCGDPFMGARTDTFRKLFYFSYLEKWFCRKADYISVPTEGSISAYYPEFRSKIRVIPQGFDFDAVQSFEDEVKNSVPTFAYAGGFIPGKRDPRPFMDFLGTLKIDFKFHIYSAQIGLIKDRVDSSGGRIVWHPVVPRAELLSRLARMDFLVNFDNNVSMSTPSKLIDYALVKRPILNITAFLDKQVISEFLSGNYTQQFVVENIKQYDIRNVVKKFIGLIPGT